LDRTGVLKNELENQESPAEIHHRLKRAMDPRRGRTKRALAKATQLLLGALACAAIIVMFLPREMPPEPRDTALPPMIGMDLISLTSDLNAAPLVYTQEQVNRYLAAHLRRKNTPGTTGWFALERVVLRFEEERCAVTVQRKVLGRFSLYVTTSYRVRIEPRKIVAEPTGAFVGQMPIHPALLKAGNPLMQSAWTALIRERNSVARLARIEFHQQSVRLFAR
jgi:hypothetical protein